MIGVDPTLTAHYARRLDQAIARRGNGNPAVRMEAVDLDPALVRGRFDQGGWDEVAELLIEAARQLEAAGAGVIGLASAPIHQVADQVAGAIDIPLISAIGSAAQAIRQGGWGSVGLLGSRFTFYAEFFRRPLKDRTGARLLLPEPIDVELLQELIEAQEPASDRDRAELGRVVEVLLGLGAEAVLITEPALGQALNWQAARPVIDLAQAQVKALIEAAA